MYAHVAVNSDMTARAATIYPRYLFFSGSSIRNMSLKTSSATPQFHVLPHVVAVVSLSPWTCDTVFCVSFLRRNVCDVAVLHKGLLLS